MHTIERALIRRAVEGVQKIAPSQIEKELREQRELLTQPKTHRIVLIVACKPRNQPNQNSVQAPQNVERIGVFL